MSRDIQVYRWRTIAFLDLQSAIYLACRLQFAHRALQGHSLLALPSAQQVRWQEPVGCQQKMYAVQSGSLTIANTMHASSGPAPLDITSRVKSRRNTTKPETSVKASTMILTRVPAGVELSRSMMALVLDGRVDRTERRRKPRRRTCEGSHGSSLHIG